MEYYLLKSTILANKKHFSLKETSQSFFVTGEKSQPYIEPTFEKVVYETERPTIILISAVGATGKSALSHQLSRDTSLPILDLGKHKPVGDNTLTGLLTHSFHMSDIGSVLEGLAAGSYGVIIDGVDEGRSKTTEEAFEAFLDDIARLCQPSSGSTFVMLGRAESMEICWGYLLNKGIEPALITILPFTIDSAKTYIDAFTSGTTSAYAQQYTETRDFIVDKLGTAFARNPKEKSEEFLSFIGYPPVLDAIATLLNEEKNYHKLLEDLNAEGGSIIEVSLLHRIATYILQRERDEKVIPNIVRPLVDNVPDEIRVPVLNSAFSVEEQCARLVAYCLGRPLTLLSISEPTINEKYEASLATSLPEHPFITGRKFRNALFEAMALATLMTLRNRESESLLKEYMASHKHSYHLVYMLDTISSDHHIAIDDLNALFLAAMEFRSAHAIVELRVDGPDFEDLNETESSGDVEIEIEILLGAQQEASKTFAFRAEITSNTNIFLGPRLAGAFVSVPCSVTLGGTYELEITAPVEITAQSVALEAKSLILRPTNSKDNKQEVIIESQRLESRLESVTTNGVPFVLAVADTSGLSYPAIQHVQKTSHPPADSLLRQKYFRIRRILVEFRSHSKGALARYKGKIESERVLKNDIGQAILTRLLADKILSLKDSFYYLDPVGLNNHLGVTWPDLRKGQMPESLLNYLRGIT